MEPWQSVLMALGAAIGGGGLTKIIERLIDVYKAKAKADADVATMALSLAEGQREDTQQHATGWRECEQRCAELAVESGDMRERMAKLEGVVAHYVQHCEQLERDLAAERAMREALENAHGNALQKVELLELQASALFDELTTLRKSISAQRPGDTTEADTDPPHADDRKITITEYMDSLHRDRSGFRR